MGSSLKGRHLKFSLVRVKLIDVSKVSLLLFQRYFLWDQIFLIFLLFVEEKIFMK